MPPRARQISLKECYDILHLQKGATLADVKSAYRRRAFELHPDLHPGDPGAARQFQMLNEAYVALSAMLKPVEEARQKAEARKAAGQQHTTQEEKKEPPRGESAHERDASRASAAYAQQDVLRDLLNDQFARRVFEDIYRELNRKQSAQEQPRPQPGPAQEKPENKAPPRQAKPSPPRDKTPEKGVKGAVKDWLRKQIDEEQSLTLPAAGLVPGRKIRLQIRQGMSEEISTVEVTLPPDFAVGKPMRLKGLGKRVGPWQGDLYLTIHTP